MSKNTDVFDRLLQLRAEAQAALIATTVEAPIALDGVSQRDFRAVLNLEAAALAPNNNETYQIDIMVCDTSGGTFKTVATAYDAEIKAAGRGKINLAISGQRIASVNSNAQYFLSKLTVGGTAPSLPYNAFLTLAHP